jgi:dienelactone hydrolase
MEGFANITREEIMKFVQTKGNWNIAKIDLEKVLEYYKKDGCTSFGIFGFCWGGKIACMASAEVADIKAAGLIHPSMINLEDADNVNCPMILLPTKDEPDMMPFYEKLQQRLGGSCKHVRFDDMFHGFAGARGNLEDELNRKRVDEAISLIHEFCSQHVK